MTAELAVMSRYFVIQAEQDAENINLIFDPKRLKANLKKYPDRYLEFSDEEVDRLCLRIKAVWTIFSNPREKVNEWACAENFRAALSGDTPAAARTMLP